MPYGSRVEYSGCLLRSDIELRWAMQFDLLGIQWEYEPIKFTCGAARYTPDFAIFRRSVFIEVKYDFSKGINRSIHLLQYNLTKPSYGHPLLLVAGKPSNFQAIAYPGGIMMQRFSDIRDALTAARFEYDESG